VLTIEVLGYSIPIWVIALLVGLWGYAKGKKEVALISFGFIIFLFLLGSRL
jgi:hypothetical protein